MSRTLANKTLLCIAVALAWATLWALSANNALAAGGGTGGASAPTSGQATGAQSNSKQTTGVQPTGKQASNDRAKHRGAGRDASAHGTQIATWFGPGFYGQQTACGQTMTPTIVGVASRTLPCGTLVLIAYKGHHLTVPVIDRGPYAHNGATWDLTWGAASALSITETVRIRTKIVGSAPNNPLLGVPTPSPLELASGGTGAS